MQKLQYKRHMRRCPPPLGAEASLRYEPQDEYCIAYGNCLKGLSPAVMGVTKSRWKSFLAAASFIFASLPSSTSLCSRLVSLLSMRVENWGSTHVSVK